jgi:hypothetical protein
MGGQSVSEGFPFSPFDVYIAAMESHLRFGNPQRLESVRGSGLGTEVNGPGIALLGRFRVVWTGRDGDRFVVRSRAVTGGPTRTLSPAGEEAVLSGAATSRDGTTVIGWSTGIHGHDPDPNTPSRLQASTALGPPQDIGPADIGTATAAFAVSPAGVPVAAWLSGSGDGTLQYAHR